MSDDGYLTREEIEKIVDDCRAEYERQRVANGYSHCSTCGKPLGARFNVPTECSECLTYLTIPEFLRR